MAIRVKLVANGSDKAEMFEIASSLPLLYLAVDEAVKWTVATMVEKGMIVEDIKYLVVTLIVAEVDLANNGIYYPQVFGLIGAKFGKVGLLLTDDSWFTTKEVLSDRVNLTTNLVLSMERRNEGD